MSLLQEIKEKALSLLDNAKDIVSRNTEIYDASKNYIMVAGFILDGVTTSVVSSETITNQERGVHATYHSYYDVEDVTTLTITTLPTASCNQILNLLAVRQKDSKGWFKITVVENGITVGVYRSFIISKTELNLQKESQDRQWVFGLVAPV